MDHYDAIKATCERFGVSPELVTAMVSVESSFDPWAYRFEPEFAYTLHIPEHAKANHITAASERTLQKSSFGLMQVMGGTARWLGFKGPLPQLFEPAASLEYGVRYIVWLQGRYRNDVPAVIAAYNAGGARRGAQGKFKNQEHVDKVLAELARFTDTRH